MYEKMVGLELEDEEGNVTTFTVRRIITQEPDNPTAVFSNELIFRPGGGAIAKRVDNRVQTLADDSIADAHRRQAEEVDAMRARSMTAARTGGEQSIVSDQERPGRRPRRGSRTTEDASGDGEGTQAA